MAFDRAKPFNDLPLLPPLRPCPADHHVKNLCMWGLSCKEFAIFFT